MFHSGLFLTEMFKKTSLFHSIFKVDDTANDSLFEEERENIDEFLCRDISRKTHVEVNWYLDIF